MSFEPHRLSVAGDVRAMPGYDECGDAFCHFQTETHWCAALIDGVGHGSAAAAASSAAVAFLRANDWECLTPLIKDLDRVLRSTRGAVMTLVRIDRRVGTLTHIGVGNVEVLGDCEQPIRPITTPGIVGAGVRRVVEREYQLHRGDVLVAFTDGVSSRFPTEVLRNGDAKETVRTLLSEWGKDHDDAGCMVICC